MRSYLGCFFVVAALGCGGSKPSTASAPTASVTPTPAPTSAAAKLPPELVKVLPDAKLKHGPFAWPPGGSSAVVSSPTPMGVTDYLVWSGAGESDKVQLPRASTRGILKDITGDGVAELLVFVEAPPEPTVWYEARNTVVLMTVTPKHRPARMWRLEHDVDGATDEAMVAREMKAPFAAAKDSPIKMLARMGRATAQEVEGLVGSAGVKACSRRASKRTCRTLAANSVGKSLGSITGPAVFAELQPAPDADPGADGLEPPGCSPDEKRPALIRCSANSGGPSGSDWVFEKLPTGVRLVEVGTWAEDS